MSRMEKDNQHEVKSSGIGALPACASRGSSCPSSRVTILAYHRGGAAGSQERHTCCLAPSSLPGDALRLTPRHHNSKVGTGIQWPAPLVPRTGGDKRARLTNYSIQVQDPWHELYTPDQNSKGTSHRIDTRFTLKQHTAFSTSSAPIGRPSLRKSHSR